jgi:hypothetical protein
MSLSDQEIIDRFERRFAAIERHIPAGPGFAPPRRTSWSRTLGLLAAGVALVGVALAGLSAGGPASPQLWPEAPLPAPYDWSGVQSALAGRGFELSEPTASERARATATGTDIQQRIEAEMTAEDPRARVVSVYLAAVTYASERLERNLVRELMFVSETTGHDTGNCFDLRPATASDAPIFGACFFGTRDAPPAVTRAHVTWR